jgi:hypothetical protein
MAAIFTIVRPSSSLWDMAARRDFAVRINYSAGEITAAKLASELQQRGSRAWTVKAD